MIVVPLSRFFKEVSKQDFLYAHPLFFLVGLPEYPVLFCSLITSFLKKQHGSLFQIVDLTQEEMPVLQSRCESTFLGTRMIYWLRGAYDLDALERKKLEEYLLNYKGPNILLYVAPDSLVQEEYGVRIELPKEVGKQALTDMLQFSGMPLTPMRSRAIDALCLRLPAFSLDAAALLVSYVSLAGTGFEQFLDQWLEHVVASELSLFTLSQHFFARDARRFFSLYARIKDVYAPAFWTTFWSEQIWRAHQYRHFMDQKKMREAKLVAFRLPFSFIQRDWRNCSLHELKAAHDMITDIDVQMKNGGDPFVFDVLYTKFLTKNF